MGTGYLSNVFRSGVEMECRNKIPYQVGRGKKYEDGNFLQMLIMSHLGWTLKQLLLPVVKHVVHVI